MQDVPNILEQRKCLCSLCHVCSQVFVLFVVDMRAFDELRKLEMFFREEDRHGCSVIDLYELVQHAGNILPRL